MFAGATCRWDDSGGDDDFDDCVVRLELIPTFVAPMPVVTTKSALASPAVTAHALVSIAAIAAAADASDDEEWKRNVKAQSEASIRSIAERYRRARSAVDPFPAPLSSALILAAHLELQLASMSQDSAVAAGLKDAQRIVLRKRDRTDGVFS
jgi:hypothetical protein